MKLEYSNLDVLRSVAVTCVVVCHVLGFYGIHVYHGLDFGCLGALGVSVFFVHTALVLLQSLERQSGPLWIPFMIRRCFRIYPLAVFAVSIVWIFKLPQASISTGHFVGWNCDVMTVVVNLFLVQGLTFMGSIIGPMWSLSYEMQMYALLPVLFLVKRLRTIVLLTGVAFVSGAVLQHYFGLPTLLTYAPCFMAGVIGYRLFRQRFIKLPAVYYPVFIAVVLGLLLAGVGGWITTVLQKIYIIGPVFQLWWLTCFVIGLSIPLFSQIEHPWIVRSAKYVARYSYGVYLFHYFCMWITLEKLGRYPVAIRGVAFIVVLLAVPVVFFHLIEDRFIQYGKIVADRYVTHRGETYEAAYPGPASSVS